MVQAPGKALLLGGPGLLDAPQLVLQRHAGGAARKGLVLQVGGHGDGEQVLPEGVLQQRDGVWAQVLHHKFRLAAVGQAQHPAAVGGVDVLAGGAHHAVQGQKGVGHALHIVHGPRQQHIVSIQQAAHRLKVAGAVQIVAEAGHRQAGKGQRLLRAEGEDLSLQFPGAQPAGQVQLAQHPVPLLAVDPHGGRRLPAHTGGDQKGLQGRKPGQPGALGAEIGQQVALAADAHVPGGGIEHGVQGGLLQGAVHPLLGAAAVKGQGGRHPQEVAGVDVGDVPGVIGGELVVGAALGDGALAHSLAAPVIIGEPRPAGPLRRQKARNVLLQLPGRDGFGFGLKNHGFSLLFGYSKPGFRGNSQ